ncbi:cytochrome P450 4V2-like [Polistes fuscatus]|uniref:cytochrome P450 4V2-like n=1 Tax=Polistes fuscatus TaxID=30207 RepID=UPI001CA82D90|nr:cytochrome P450 4V2-like [Polistes fuscatus]
MFTQPTPIRPMMLSYTDDNGNVFSSMQRPAGSQQHAKRHHTEPLYYYFIYNLIKLEVYQGPKAYPLIGNLNMFLGDTKGILLFNIYNIYIYILSKSSNGYEKSSLYEFTKNALGNGLFTVTESIWEIHRIILNPVFKERMVSTFLDSIVKNSNRLTNNLETTKGKNVDFMHYVHLCTLDITYDSLLENDLNLQSNLDCKLDEYLSEKKKESMNEDNFTQEGKGPHARKGTSPFLDAIFKSFYETGEYSEADIRDEINTMVFAGSDTAATTLTFLFLMLATFPDIQNQVYEELYDMYGSSDPKDVPITMEDIKSMKYLERVIKETLRLFPPAPFFGRTLHSDTKVNDNVILPKNCQVIFKIFSLHRKEKYWTDPLRFNPDRFLPGNYNSKCFLPFSFGKRGCLGQIFGMTQIKAIAATVLRKFIVQIDDPVSVENVALKFSITLTPAETIFLRFDKR